jgi:acyl-coenzyme A synthetase/AMP-(fatty) acid ligase
MMTSGTTGRPKIAMHQLESLLGRVRSAAANPRNREGRWLLTYQTTGFAGVQVLLTAVLSRSVLAVPDERTPSGFYQAACAASVQQISGTPTFWRSFLMVAERGVLDLRQITIGGEAVDQATLDRVKAGFPRARVTHIYASTEAGAVFAVNDGLAGFPRAWLEQEAQGVSLRVRDGFLQIRSPHLMRAYASQEQQPLLEDGWLGTADQCEIVGDRVVILGRKDSTINVGGSKVYPLTIETALLALPEVVEARAFGVSNPISGNLVAAEVVIAPGLDRGQARTTILQQCRARLEKHQVPRVLKVVDAIVVRESGKKG